MFYVSFYVAGNVLSKVASKKYDDERRCRENWIDLVSPAIFKKFKINLSIFFVDVNEKMLQWWR